MNNNRANTDWNIRVMKESRSVLFLNNHEQRTVLYTENDIKESLSKARNQIQGPIPFGLLLTASAIFCMKDQCQQTSYVSERKQDHLIAA